MLEIPKITHHRPLLDAIAGLAAMLFIALLLSLYGVQKVWTRLADAVASLHKVGPENAAPTVGHGTEIAEIEEVRRLIDDSRIRQEQAYAAMNESEDRYRSFFVHSIDAVLYTAPDGRILAANPEACTIFGRTEKEICALGRGGIVDTSDPRLSLALEERRRTGRFRGELNMLRRDGSSFPAEISTAVFPDRNGELRTSMIVRDATERRQAQERILLLNNRLQYLIEVLQQLSGAHTLEKIAIAVRTAARKLAVSDGATFIMRDGSFSHYVDEDAITPLWKGSRFPLERCISGWSMLHREPVIIEDVFLDDRIPKDLYRETFVQSLAIVPIDVDEPRGAIGVYWATRTRPNDDAMQLLETLANTTAIAMENIRSYRELEMRVQERTAELARANEHLQDLDRLKSLFIASMSHELRTPLNSILGFTGIILMGMSGGLNETQRLQLTMVRTSARHLLELINDVIDVSKIEAGKTDLDLETFDCTELAVEVRDSFSPAAAEKGIDLQLETPDHVLITSDRRRVRQILVNLVGNGVKFTTEGGVQVTLDGPEGSIRVRVKDTGIGIRKEDMERLFQAFSRISIHGRPMVEGTGLGLYLSMKIATLLGGSISVESESGKGSSFTLTLPRQHPEASS